MKKYTGSCYIGVVGPESDGSACWQSIQSIARRPGDAAPLKIISTKGYESRQTHLNNWIDHSHHEFALFLDSDMLFPADTLERLRSHELPYVSGLYVRRSYTPIVPIWFKPWSGSWPIVPWTDPIERNKLHKIGASGWGCVLVHRDVVLAMREKVLKGELEILEDDMDVWPYDLDRTFAAVNGLAELVDTKPPAATLRAALEQHVTALRQELRPLRSHHTIVGSDIRFPFMALQAGFQLWGDPEVRCGHVINYPLHPDDFQNIDPEVIKSNNKIFKVAELKERKQIREARDRVGA